MACFNALAAETTSRADSILTSRAMTLSAAVKASTISRTTPYGAASMFNASAATPAAIATAVWTDTTGSDFTTASSPGKILKTQLGGTFTTTSSSIFSAASLVNTADPWATELPGTYVDGTAGSILGNLSDTTSLVNDIWSAELPAGFAIGTAGYIIGTLPDTSTIVGDVWAVDLPGSYTDGQAGNIIGNLPDATTLITDIWAADLPGTYIASQAGYIVGTLADVPTMVTAVWTEPVPELYAAGTAGWYQGHVIAGLGF